MTEHKMTIIYDDEVKHLILMLIDSDHAQMDITCQIHWNGKLYEHS